MSAVESISDKFDASAKGSDTTRDTELDSANDATYNSAPRPDLLQTVSVKPVADPNQNAANQPSVTDTQKQAAQQRDQLTSKAPGGVGAALSAGSSAQAGAARQETAQKEATKLATNVAKLDKVIAGDQPKAPEGGGNKLAGAAIGQGLNMAAAAAATVVAGPAAGAAVAAAGLAYDVAAVFSGRSGDSGSSFGSRAESSGYKSSAPSQPAQQVSTGAAFLQNMMNIPGGGRRIDAGSIETTSDGLRGIKQAPPLALTAAAVALAGVSRNGAEIRAAQGDNPDADKKNKLEFEPMPLKPNPGVFQAAAPKPFFG